MSFINISSPLTPPQTRPDSPVVKIGQRSNSYINNNNNNNNSNQSNNNNNTTTTNTNSNNNQNSNINENVIKLVDLDEPIVVCRNNYNNVVVFGGGGISSEDSITESSNSNSTIGNSSGGGGSNQSSLSSFTNTTSTSGGSGENSRNDIIKNLNDNEDDEVQRYTTAADSIVFQYLCNTTIVEDYAYNDNNNHNNNHNNNNKNSNKHNKEDELETKTTTVINNNSQLSSSFTLDEPIYNFLQMSEISSSPNSSPNQSQTRAERTQSTVDIIPNYHELHQEMTVVLYKDKIICRPIISSNNNNSTPTSTTSTGSSTSPPSSPILSSSPSPLSSPPPSQLSNNNNNNNNAECLVIDRQTCSLSLQSFSSIQCGSAAELPMLSNVLGNGGSGSFSMTGSGSSIATQTSSLLAGNNSFTAYGIVGILNLLSGPHLVLITSRTLRGSLKGKQIYEIDAIQFVPINNSVELGEHDKRLESTYKRSLNNLLRSDFYFAYDMDISNSAQRNSVMNQYEPINHLYQLFEDRFYWNKSIQQPLIEKELTNWILPIIRGCMLKLHQQKQQNNKRSKFRAGTRYNTRGSDLNGNVANYVETEQVLQVLSPNNPKSFSFVQTRGSIPLVWEQNGRRIKPVIRINPDQSLNLSTFKSHFKEQISLYGPQTLVTLLDQKGSESFLGDSYQQTLQICEDYQSDIEYIAFDFHHFCQGNRFERVDILIDNLEEKIKSIGYLEKDLTGYKSYQNGTVRTNCLDCLDRTNLVQSMIGLKILEKQIASVGYDLNSKDSMSLLKQVKLAWANNGDAISQQYAGTSALKGDFTRTGKRNTKGVFRDGVNSLSRYYINTFLDKLRQISIDLFLGNITVETNRTNIIENQTESDWGESRMNAISNCVDHFLMCEKDDQHGFVNAWIVISINKRNQEQERILLLTPTHLVRCKYNFNDNRIVHYKKYAVNATRRIQKGSILTEGGKKASYGMRIYYENSKSSAKKSKERERAEREKEKENNNINTYITNSTTSTPISIHSNFSSSSPDIGVHLDSNNNNNNNNSNSHTQLNASEIKDYIYQTFIVPIPQGETIEFSKDLISEMAETIKDTVFTGSLANTHTVNSSAFIVEQDFKRKSTTFGAAYNGLKLGFYSKSPTVGSKGSLSQVVTKRRSNSFDLSSLRQELDSNAWDFDATLNDKPLRK
ncbi:hypothetical protein PPL_11180 [Heterostelium album PN500]|uniref:SAC domain-containing protein n=1 Tax=Heterostelium pallidum (strain ATCC 26659 / Pp 5 / PN500) TaxID=670386 RepID=D3BTS0_HETP5|nr:hypothetical protein PPL_11180 [Heterostelium album PN500]EFA75106.1 hypothetical protein PPL_11180 [Heterostelium album PN500]|eukprot:XP_020427240.1 hypothetical protein PPL_11180 [Heterostelium album PN500]